MSSGRNRVSYKAASLIRFLLVVTTDFTSVTGRFQTRARSYNRALRALLAQAVNQNSQGPGSGRSAGGKGGVALLL